MHDTQRQLIAKKMAQHFKESHPVYDIGSFDVNGSHKQDVLNLKLEYIGCDIEKGKNVDIVIDKNTWNPIKQNSVHYLISGSCLEHVEAPWIFAKCLYNVMAPDGIAIVLAPFNIVEHRYPVDCYRYLPDGLKYLFGKEVPMKVLECNYTSGKKDTYIVVQK